MNPGMSTSLWFLAVGENETWTGDRTEKHRVRTPSVFTLAG